MSQYHMKVTVSSHNFACTRLSPRGRELCNIFARKFLAWGWENVGGRFTKVMKKVYASATDDRSTYRFHINSLDDFKKMLTGVGISLSLIEWVESAQYEPVKAKFTVRDGWVPKDYQGPVIEYLTAPTPAAKIAELPTGYGKGFCAIKAISDLGVRCVGIIKPQYIAKWVIELKQILTDVDDEILVVRGDGQLTALIDLAREGKLTEKIILISGATFRNWISKYEEVGEEILDLGYSCTPYNFFEYIGAGVRLIDECHQDFHFYFKLDTYSNIPASISLSATLINKDPFLVNMYSIMFPLNDRLPKMAMDRYIDVGAVHFNFKDASKIRTVEYGSRSYSHGAVEKSIIRHVPTMLNYFKLIKHILDISYFRNKLPEDKAIIFAASIDLCTRLTKYLKAQYPHLDIRRYVEDDPYENIIDADIRVTTIGSGGTAIDIPNLSTGIMTTALDSIQGNAQALGRLRRRKEGKTEFYYFVADNIEKQMHYHVAKKDFLADRVKTFRDINSGHSV